MDIAMLPTTMVNVVFRHSDFRPIENGRLIHVVPDVDRLGTLRPTPLFAVAVELEDAFPPVPSFRVEEIDPGGAARPTPTFVLVAVNILDEDIDLLGSLVDWVIVYAFDVRIDNRYKLN
jgi:hypothetical protein